MHLFLNERRGSSTCRKPAITSVGSPRVFDLLPKNNENYVLKNHQNNLLDAQKGIVLGNTLTSCGSTGLDLTNTKSNGKIGDNGVLSLTTTVGNHDTPTV
jgi:hypothetical protein